MTTVILFVLLISFAVWVAYGATTVPERKRFLQWLERQVLRLAEEAPLRNPQIASFWAVLRQRTRRAPLTPILAGLNVIVFVLMLFSAGPINSSDTVIAWGGSFGPRTTNGEWWRLATTMFVHVTTIHLLVDVIGLLAVGLVLERIVGPLAFAVVYAAGGASSTALGLDASPTGMTLGASGAIFGLYGLMLAVVGRSIFRRSTEKIPLALARYVVPAAAVFALYSLQTMWIASGPELSALVVGCLSGLVVGRTVGEERPRALFSVPIAAGALAMVIVTVLPLRGMTDVRPEIVQLVTAEQKMSARYQRATNQFLNGYITAPALAGVIDHDILPQMQVLQVRIASLQHVPDEQKPLLAAAQKYVKLRDESWRTRLTGLNVGSESMLRQAERSEMAATDTLREIE